MAHRWTQYLALASGRCVDMPTEGGGHATKPYGMPPRHAKFAVEEGWEEGGKKPFLIPFFQGFGGLGCRKIVTRAFLKERAWRR